MIPAQSLKKNMVALSAELDASEEAHGGVTPLLVLKHNGVQVLYCDPSKYICISFYV